ncbi:MAG: biotin carboxylase N-terminal domain-containing protein [Thermomicrobiales bacterium]
MAIRSLCASPTKRFASARPSSRSYTNIPAIISAALVTGCDALHPGYGFLAENSYLAEICEQVGVTFIGPSAAVIEKMGNKASARAVMREAGVLLLPGTQE